MKKVKVLLSILIAGALAGCSKDVDPEVDTLYVSSRADASRAAALSNLYEHYSKSDKSKEYYEVIAGRNYIVNYYPTGKLLTACLDPSSGWTDQFKNVDEVLLKKLSDHKVSLDSMQHYAIKDSALQNNRPLVPVKTNGNP